MAAWCNINFNGSYSNPLYFAHNLYLNNDLVENLVIPNTVTYINKGVFSNCESLTTLVIPNSVSVIDSRAFYYCTKLTSVVFPNSVKIIGDNAFNYCTSLKTAELPNSVTTIGYASFQGCKSLETMVIPNSVTSIGMVTFESCSSLKSVIIGESISKIDYEAFGGCTNLNEIISLNITPPTIDSESFTGVSKAECLLKVPEEAVDAYKSAEGWNAFWNIVGLNGEGGGSESPETKVCETPEISFVDGKIVAKSATEGSKCYTSITSEDFKGVDGNEPITISGIYKVSSYAHAEGYQNSETVTKEINIMGDIITNIVEVHDTIYIYDDSRADIALVDGTKCTLYVQDGVIYIADAPSGTPITVCDISGKEVAILKAEEYVTKIELSRDNVYIINVGGTVFKIKI